MKEISIKTANLNSNDIKNLEQNGKIDLEINKKSITLELDDFQIVSQDIEGWLVTHEGSLTVALDIVITDKLRGEGIAREIVSKIQNIRKNSNFEVTDRINISLLDDANIKVAIQDNLNYIKTETLANNLEIVSNLKKGDHIEFDDVKTKIFITKI
jgi:isoleucyl-tRNA synthetase